jgi:hypothetical protein
MLAHRCVHNSSQGVIGSDIAEAFGGCTTKYSICTAAHAGQRGRFTALEERAIRDLFYAPSPCLISIRIIMVPLLCAKSCL